MGGLEVCRRIRRISQIPVIIVTGEYLDSGTTVRALGMGADDYVRKPYEPMELVARVRAVLRRAALTQDSNEHRPPYQHGDLRFDFDSWLASVSGQELQLSATETWLLAYLALYAGRVVPHQELLREVWGPEYVDDKLILKVAISRLRSKISGGDKSPGHITTRSGVGYMAARAD